MQDESYYWWTDLAQSLGYYAAGSHLYRSQKLLRAAALTEAELAYQATRVGKSFAPQALALEWHRKGIRGHMGMPRKFGYLWLHGGTPYDQQIAHGRKFKPGWLPKKVNPGTLRAARISSRVIPVIGTAMLAYDAYDLLWNGQVWGFQVWEGLS